MPADTKSFQALPAQLTSAHAWSVVLDRAPGIAMVSERLRWHPFSGFEYKITHPLNMGGSPQRAFAIVDRLTGQATLTDPWPDLVELDERQRTNLVTDPGWNTTSFAEAGSRAHRLVATAAIRKHRLSTPSTVTGVRTINTLWKPNWLLEARLAGRRLQILVDAVTGGYYVVGT
ncbi:hypothetical protein [Leucobacter aridicollis]|uniref:hypothetical protein n=1 Tax=Leucobacter aridicollis TaxID=283878 RepID=UPI002101EECC|nr:hypothetical protein [Leucobacter aridicollis]UTX53534.1 hypothetical protein KI794_01905 [Leucobacter aridicollis]